jgi:Reverse transcriptase (RNA-dependent DNA polymerase)
MTFGLCNAPTTFQTFMNNIFKDLIDTGQVVIYLDDILVFTHTTTQLDKLTRQVLEHLECYDLFLKPEKCFFDHTSIEYLGVIITEGQVKMDPAKIDGITNWPTLKTLKNMQAFLGFCNFYRRFIKDFSAVAHPALAVE